MIARVKVTGEIVNVKFKICEKNVFLDESNRTFVRSDLEFDSSIDWKKVRVEIAMKLVERMDLSNGISKNWSDFVFEKANCLTKKLMEDIK